MLRFALCMQQMNQMDPCELKANLGYTKLVQKQIRVVAVHTFNPSPRESHTFNHSTRVNIKWEEKEVVCLVCCHADLVEVRIP